VFYLLSWLLDSGVCVTKLQNQQSLFTLQILERPQIPKEGFECLCVQAKDPPASNLQ